MQRFYRLKINQDVYAIYSPDNLGLVFCDKNAIDSTEDIFKIKSKELQKKVEQALSAKAPPKCFPTRPVVL